MKWLFAPVPLARVAWMRVVAYSFLPIDLLLTTQHVVLHAQVPGALYEPLLIGRLLHLPTPGPWILILRMVLLVAAVAAAVLASRNQLSRWAGYTLALGYAEWLVVANSYGKVDHDRFAFLLLLFVLPSVGHAGLRENKPSAAAGWAVAMTTLAVAATYTLSAYAKLRFGGLAWLDGATISRAVLRRGTAWAMPLLDHPQVLRASQYGIVAMELFIAPLLLVNWRRPYVRLLLVVGFLGFHVLTQLTIKIAFLPHCVALLFLLPLERLSQRQTSASGVNHAHLV